jgi:hypothetical protein
MHPSMWTHALTILFKRLLRAVVQPVVSSQPIGSNGGELTADTAQSCRDDHAQRLPYDGTFALAWIDAR